MLFWLLSFAPAPPVAVDVTGMAPQLEIIRRDADQRGWRISCEGRAGEEGVIRLAFPSGIAREEIDTYFDADHHLGSSQRYYYARDTLPEQCDQEPAVSSASEPAPVLALGPRESLSGLTEVARACGFAGATLREIRAQDILSGQPDPPENWLALDAGEDASARHGPAICFLQLGVRPLLAGSHR